MSRIDSITAPCFDAIIGLRGTAANARLEAHNAYHALRLHIDTMIGRALSGGLSRDDVNDMTYAVIALADETALGIAALTQFWLPRLLQSHYFNQDDASEVFFQRLERCRHSQPPRHDVLYVYYICLTLGFQGRYRRQGGSEQLNELITELRHDVLTYTPDTPSLPTGRRRALPGGPSLLKAWAPLTLPCIASLLAAAFYYALELSIQQQAHAMARWIKALITSQ